MITTRKGRMVAECGELCAGNPKLPRFHPSQQRNVLRRFRWIRLDTLPCTAGYDWIVRRDTATVDAATVDTGLDTR